MKIKMKTLMSGPNGTRHPDQICTVGEDIEKKEAKQLLDGGYAEVVPDAGAQKSKQAEEKARQEAEAARQEKVVALQSELDQLHAELAAVKAAAGDTGPIIAKIEAKQAELGAL